MTQIVIFPPAGGASPGMRDWVDQCKRNHMPVKLMAYPGHFEDLATPPVDSIEHLSECLLSRLESVAKQPLVLLGHSLGGYVAFETGIKLIQKGCSVAGLVVCASRSPMLPRLALSELDDAAIIERLEREGGDFEVLRSHSELLDLALRAVRRDLALAEAYADVCQNSNANKILQATGLGIWGAEDSIAGEQSSQYWAQRIGGRYHSHTLPGCGHYPIEKDGQRVLNLIKATLIS